MYNEYIILYCFDIEHDTIDEVMERATLVENNPDANNISEEDDDDDDDDDLVDDEEKKLIFLINE